MTRRFQFSLKFLLLLATAASVWLAIFASRGHRQREAVRMVERLGGRCMYDFERFQENVQSYQLDIIDECWAPLWLRRLIGNEYFGDVIIVLLDDTTATDTDLEPLRHLDRLQVLSVCNTAVTERGLERVHTWLPLVQFQQSAPPVPVESPGANTD